MKIPWEVVKGMNDKGVREAQWQRNHARVMSDIATEIKIAVQCEEEK
jgi:hypothetical protein